VTRLLQLRLLAFIRPPPNKFGKHGWLGIVGGACNFHFHADRHLGASLFDTTVGFRFAALCSVISRLKEPQRECTSTILQWVSA